MGQIPTSVYLLMIVQGSRDVLPSALGLIALESTADANSLTSYGNNPQMPCTITNQQHASVMLFTPGHQLCTLDTLASAMHNADPWMPCISASPTSKQVRSQAPWPAFPRPPPPPPFPPSPLPGMLLRKNPRGVHQQHSMSLIAAAQMLP